MFKVVTWADFIIWEVASGLEFNFEDESPKVLPTARQSACGDGILGWKEPKDVIENTARQTADPISFFFKF